MQVAFSSFTDFGPMMALAIAIHNIPEVRALELMCLPNSKNASSKYQIDLIPAVSLVADIGSRVSLWLRQSMQQHRRGTRPWELLLPRYEKSHLLLALQQCPTKAACR